MKNLTIISFTVLLIALTSCLKEKTEPTGDCNTVISYTEDIRPIIEASCKTGLGPGTGCHDAWIDNYDPIKSYLDAGTWQNAVLNTMYMPIVPNDFGIDSLSDEALQTMRCWIDQGYPEN